MASVSHTCTPSRAWFEKNRISHVPLPHPGFMRRVYPSSVQLSAFISTNPERHK